MPPFYYNSNTKTPINPAHYFTHLQARNYGRHNQDPLSGRIQTSPKLKSLYYPQSPTFFIFTPSIIAIFFQNDNFLQSQFQYLRCTILQFPGVRCFSSGLSWQLLALIIALLEASTPGSFSSLPKFASQISLQLLIPSNL